MLWPAGITIQVGSGLRHRAAEYASPKSRVTLICHVRILTIQIHYGGLKCQCFSGEQEIQEAYDDNKVGSIHIQYCSA